MYTALLVDDEWQLRQSIEELVGWEECGFQLIGTAENGVEALQLIEQKGAPDLVITDIKMPVMDGIDLAKEIREAYPTVKLVFLSGYEEFQYAVAGIQLNILSYLLKPISKEDIEVALKEIKEQMDEEIRSLNDLTRIQQEYDANIELLKRSFLISLLTESHEQMTEAEAHELLPSYNLSILQEEKMVLTIQLKFQEEAPENRPSAELIRFSLSTMVQNIVEKYAQAEVFLFSSTVICLLAGEASHLEEVKDTLALEIVESARKLLNQEVYIGASERYLSILQTRKAYRAAIEALDYAWLHQKGNVFYASDIETSSGAPAVFDHLDESALLLAFKTGDEKRIEQMLSDCFKETYSVEGDRLSLIRMVLSIVYVNGMRALRESGSNATQHYGEWYQRLFGGAMHQDLSTTKEEAAEFCVSVIKDIQCARKQQTNTLVAESLRYMDEHFNEPELTLKSISQHLAISPTYFSAIFKKETGQSFIEALTERKMTHAKELVLTTDEKMFEIASRCGYIDQHYFSYSFKKHHGISPTQMRRELDRERTS